MRRLKFLIALGALFVPVCAHAAPPAQTVMGSWMGVQVKEEKLSSEDMDRIKAAGFDTVRFPLPWDYIERARGDYRWRHFESVVERLREKGLKAVIILGGGNVLYAPKGSVGCGGVAEKPKTCPPRTPEEVDAFTRFAVTAVTKFGTDDIVWEIWNEPDTRRFWAPHPDPEAYTALAGETCRAVKNVAPDAQIIGPALADMPGVGEDGTHFARIFLSGNAACFDGFSLHTYRDGATPPESVLQAYAATRIAIGRLTPWGQKPLPLFVTEWGFSDVNVGSVAQADDALRVFLLSAVADIPLTIWYEWRDSPSDDPDDPEGHYGLLTSKREPKATYKALTDVLAPLRGAKLEKRLDMGAESRWALVFRRPDASRALVFWAVQAKPGELIQIKGVVSGEYPLTERPQIVEIPQGDLSAAVVPGTVAP